MFSNAEEGGKLIDSTTEFAFDLFCKLSEAKNGGNVFLSPSSISTALAMTYAGARAKTAKQMSDVLRFSYVSPDHLHSSFSELMKSLVGGDHTLHVANKLYVQEKHIFLEDFLDIISKNYETGAENVDFEGHAAQAIEIINHWVEMQTNSKIKNLLVSGSIDSLTRLVLVNAIYFKGDWHNKFNPTKTKDYKFTLQDGTSVEVPLMYMKNKLKYGHSRELNVKALELPYAGKKLSMIILLPESHDGVSLLEQELKADHVVKLEKRFKMHKVEVETYLPRFKLEDSFDLGETLVAMGMTDAFDATLADFSGIDGTRNLSISQVVHKAFLEVNEEGSEAAAATAVIVRDRCRKISPSFKADHAFLFFIRENESKAILFFGKLSCPARTTDKK